MNSPHPPRSVEVIGGLDDLRGDLARSHPATAAAVGAIDPAATEADLAALARDGYVIWENLVGPEECDELRAALVPLLGRTGRNTFEGERTRRVYNLVAKTRACDEFVTHPRVLALVDRLLLPNYLLSQLQAIEILPGEQAQLPHHDDGFYPVPRPRPALSAATMWAIDEFTENNGGTVLLPGSHRWDDARHPASTDTRVVARMPAGSCAFYLGTLWHGGGENRSGAARLGLTVQYCEPWLRPQEAYTLGVGRDTVRAVSEDLRRLLGYSIHPPFMGSVDGVHPKRLLEQQDSSAR